jgi:hypothetical protein
MMRLPARIMRIELHYNKALNGGQGFIILDV